MKALARRLLQLSISQVVCASIGSAMVASAFDHELGASMRARTGDQARAAEANGFESRVLRATCVAELEALRVPSSCYRLDALDSLPPVAWLEDACVEAAQRAPLAEVDRLERLSPNIPDNSRCRAAVDVRLEELTYILAKSRPSELARRASNRKKSDRN